MWYIKQGAMYLTAKGTWTWDKRRAKAHTYKPDKCPFSGCFLSYERPAYDGKPRTTAGAVEVALLADYA